jgi:3',5'-cyclic AMP phosphodiesterase CpdA
MRLIHLSDPHFGGENPDAVAGATAFVRADPPDIAIITGDLTLNGLPKEFKAAAAWLAALPRPWLATPGNHDTPYWNLPLRALAPFGRYSRYIGVADGEALDGPGVSVRTLTTARGAQPRLDWSKGAIDLDRCRAAAADMAGEGPDRRLKVAACHHPLTEALDAPVTGGVHRGEAGARLLAEGGVDLILTGHVHNPFVSALPFGDGHTYAVGAGTLSTRLRGTPAGFNCVDVDEETVTVTAMGWTGSVFTPYRTWAVRRRPAGASGPILAGARISGAEASA